MDGSAVSAGPWLVLGAVAGVLLALVVALATRPSRRRPAAPPPPEPAPGGWLVDDLPGWLDDPGGAPDGASATPAPLLAPSSGTERTAATTSTGTAPDDTRRTLLALSLAALLLVAAAAAIAAFGAGDRAPAARDTTGPVGTDGAVGTDGVTLDLAFEGVVLERRAVGVTATYPVLTLTAAAVPGGPAIAHLELPTFNCLTDTAPADPVAAGCLRTPVEFADLPTPALTVDRDGEGVRISGRFATYLRPAGSAPEWTGRVYPLTVTASTGGAEGTVDGVLRIGNERAEVRSGPGTGEMHLPD